MKDLDTSSVYVNPELLEIITKQKEANANRVDDLRKDEKKKSAISTTGWMLIFFALMIINPLLGIIFLVMSGAFNSKK